MSSMRHGESIRHVEGYEFKYKDIDTYDHVDLVLSLFLRTGGYFV